MGISKLPLINIITRMSGKEGFQHCRKTIDNQTYKLINHIVTVENIENEQFVKNITDEFNTSICKVTPLNKINELSKTFWYNQYTKVEELDKWKYKLWDGVEETVTHAAWTGARMKAYHFPYNLYMVKAERFVKDGWVLYLDDDDYLYNENSLEILVNNIIKFDDDTIHWIRTMNDKGIPNGYHGGLYPPDYVMDHLSKNIPPALNLICSSNFSFHSKWIPYTAWETWTGDDYRTASSLARVIDKNNSIMEVIVDKRKKQ
jgi:hypothetical protein